MESILKSTLCSIVALQNKLERVKWEQWYIPSYVDICPTNRRNRNFLTRSHGIKLVRGFERLIGFFVQMHEYQEFCVGPEFDALDLVRSRKLF